MPVVHWNPKGLFKEREAPQIGQLQTRVEILNVSYYQFLASLTLYQLMSFDPYFDL